MPMFDPNARGILAMHSGGLDSLTALYHLLRDTDRPVHAHHIRMRRSRRAPFELVAVYRQWDWLRANVRAFSSSISVDPSEDDPRFDVVPILRVAGELLPTLAGFGRVMTGWCAEDGADPFLPHWLDPMARFGEVIGVPYMAAVYLDPTRGWGKAEKAANLPPDLLGTVWGCRHVLTADLKPCGGCQPCKEYQAAGIYSLVYGV